jgi:hypothetical protein
VALRKKEAKAMFRGERKGGTQRIGTRFYSLVRKTKTKVKNMSRFCRFYIVLWIATTTSTRTSNESRMSQRYEEY